MGTMSASDAAPLPRLGEVFFDVRGNSRSMRLSWYADTGVAVLSIWQGGMCTGTFRLAIADLPRMVETLQRGPGGQQPGWDGDAPGQALAGVPGEATAQVHPMGPMSGQLMQPGPAGPTDYLAEPQGPRTGVSEYPAAPAAGRGGSGPYAAEPPAAAQAPGPRPGPAGNPGEPQPPQPRDLRGGAPDYLADPLEALGQLGVPEPPGPPSAPYQTGARDYVAEPPPDERQRPADYLTGPPPGQQTGPADYLNGPPPAQQAQPADYLSGPMPDQRPQPADYLTGPPPGQQARPADYLNGPPPAQQAQPADYLSGPMPDQRPQPADYLTGPPPGQQARPADYPPGPSGYPSAPQQRTEYLADLPTPPNAGPAGYGGDFQPADAYPGSGESGPYPQDTGRRAAYQGEQGSDQYPPAAGSMDYQGAAPGSNYPRGSSAPRSAPRSARRPAPRSPSQEDALGPTTADYPVHYGTAVTDDMGDEPPVESFPYQPRRGSR
jgi:hypothetical protein